MKQPVLQVLLAVVSLVQQQQVLLAVVSLVQQQQVLQVQELKRAQHHRR
jgi:hypothetical protein